MNLKVAKRWAAATAACLGLAGCGGSGSTAGPAPVEQPVSATTIGVVLPAEGIAELEVWDSVARRQEARTGAIVNVYRMERGARPETQADLVKRAFDDGASALVVVPADPKAVADAVAEARKAGTPVVCLDRPVPGGAEGDAAPVVVYAPEEVAAKALVEAAVKDARAAGFPPDGPALIVKNTYSDAHAKARVRALRDALGAAGVRVLPDAEFVGYMDKAKSAIKLAHEVTPHVAMVFTEDDMGLQGIAEYRHTLPREPGPFGEDGRFVLAGYRVNPDLSDLVTNNVVAALAERNVLTPMRQAVDAALSLARGETVAGEMVVPTPVKRRTGPEQPDAFPAFIADPSLLGDMAPMVGD